MLKRILATAALGGVVLASPAAAQTYVRDDNITREGETVAAYCYLGTVQFFDGEGRLLGSAEAVDGTARFQLPIDVDPAVVRAEGVGCDEDPLVLETGVTRADPLPRTGSDSTDLGRIGLLLVAAGGATVFAARRVQLARAEVRSRAS